MILAFYKVSDPSKVWYASYKILIIDILPKQKKQFNACILDFSTKQITNYAWSYIDDALKACSKSLQEIKGMLLPSKVFLKNLATVYLWRK